MLDKKEILEIREQLENSVSPLFYFDNDQDGLCSYLLLRRFIGRGNGVPVKTSPLNMDYYRRINEFNPDIVFILDQPTVSFDFFEELNKNGIKIVWIDHHEIEKKNIPAYVNYYNPLYAKDKINIPVTAICYEITKREEDLWLAVIGTIADKFIMPFYFEFLRKYPDLGLDSNDAFDVFYNSQIGKISRMLGIGLKDRTTNVVKMMKFLYTIRTPYQILEENKENYSLHHRFLEIDQKFKKYIEKAKTSYGGEKMLFFKYSGDTSMSADISNKLSYLFPGIYIIVAFIKEGRVNLSLRGENVREITAKVMKDINLGSSGGHENAIGAQINYKDLDLFIESFKNRVNSF